MDARLARYRTDADRDMFNRGVVKPFYEEEEDYDWTDVADHLQGPETILHRLRERELARYLKRFGAGEPMLDVGCGTGLMLRHLPPGSVGIDLNPRNVERARRYAPQAYVMAGDAEALSLPSDHFLTAISTEVLEHLVFPQRAVQEIYRVLKPGGVFLGSIPRHSFLWHLRALSRTCPRAEPFHNEMSRQELNRLLAPFSDHQIHLAPWLMNFFFIARKTVPELSSR